MADVFHQRCPRRPGNGGPRLVDPAGWDAAARPGSGFEFVNFFSWERMFEPIV